MRDKLKKSLLIDEESSLSLSITSVWWLIMFHIMSCSLLLECCDCFVVVMLGCIAYKMTLWLSLVVAVVDANNKNDENMSSLQLQLHFNNAIAINNTCKKGFYFNEISCSFFIHNPIKVLSWA